MPYVDGFIVPVPQKKLDAYRRIARKAGKVWMEHGALEYRECISDDINTGFGMPFGETVKAKRSEVVVFAWIVYKSRAHRDRVNKKAMQDPRLANMKPEDMPFDCNRMSYAGFKTVVNLQCE